MTKDVFSKLKATGKPKRGRGLNTPPTPENAGKNVTLPEHTPAVAVKAPPRKYRVSTYLTDEAGERFERLHTLLNSRRKSTRKIKLAEVLEQALEALEAVEK